MTSRERVLAAINHQKPDRTPMDFGGTLVSSCSSKFLQRFRELLGFSLPSDRDADGEWVDEAIQKYLNVDLRSIPFKPPLTVLRELDTVAYDKAFAQRQREQAAKKASKTDAVRHDFPMADYTYEDVKALKPNLPESVPYLDWYIETAKEYRKNGYATTFWVSPGFFEQGCWARGYDQIAMDFLLDPDLVRALFDLWLAEKLHQIETTIKPLAPYIDIFCFGDDWALQTGPFMSPEVFRTMIKPYIDIHYSSVKAAAPNSKLFHHSCGSVNKLLDDIIDLGIDILNPIQPLAVDMSPEQLKKKSKGRLCFHGGIDLQELLPNGSPDEVRAEVNSRINILGEDGGYICAAAHTFPDDVPLENLLALFDAAGGK